MRDLVDSLSNTELEQQRIVHSNTERVKQARLNEYGKTLRLE